MSQPEAGPSNTSYDSQGSMPMDITTGSIDVPTSQSAPEAQAQPSAASSSSAPASHDPRSTEQPSTTDEPPRPIQENQPDQDRREKTLFQAYEVAVRKGVNKFTAVPPVPHTTSPL